MANRYHATPYDISAIGFYFSTLEEYRDKAASHTNEYGDHVEEYEIQFIDGPSEDAALFKALSVNQANLSQWFETFEDIDEHDALKAIYLADHLGECMEDIPSKLDDVVLYEGRALDYAEQYIEDTGLLEQIPENLQFYFDTEAFARDLMLGGDITEIELCGTTYVVQAH